MRRYCSDTIKVIEIEILRIHLDISRKILSEVSPQFWGSLYKVPKLGELPKYHSGLARLPSSENHLSIATFAVTKGDL